MTWSLYNPSWLQALGRRPRPGSGGRAHHGPGGVTGYSVLLSLFWSKGKEGYSRALATKSRQSAVQRMSPSPVTGPLTSRHGLHPSEPSGPAVGARGASGRAWGPSRGAGGGHGPGVREAGPGTAICCPSPCPSSIPQKVSVPGMTEEKTSLSKLLPGSEVGPRDQVYPWWVNSASPCLGALTGTL